jgi:hypothetical protein
VSSLCVQAYQQRSLGLSVALQSAVATLAVFLNGVSRTDFISHSTQLGAALLKQVQRSGLMQLLAALMADTSAELQGQPAASPAAAVTLEQRGLCAYSNRVLIMFITLAQLLPCTPLSFDGSLAGITAAAAGLATASLQFISATMKHQQQTDPDWNQVAASLFVAVSSAVSVAVVCLEKAGGVGVLLQRPQMDQQLLVPELLSCLTADIVIEALHLTAQNEASSRRQADSRSRSSSGNGSQLMRPPAGDLVPQVNLTPSNCQLGDALGVSADTILFAVRHVAGANNGVLESTLLQYLEFVDHCVAKQHALARRHGASAAAAAVQG